MLLSAEGGHRLNGDHGCPERACALARRRIASAELGCAPAFKGRRRSARASRCRAQSQGTASWHSTSASWLGELESSTASRLTRPVAQTLERLGHLLRESHLLTEARAVYEDGLARFPTRRVLPRVGCRKGALVV